MGRPRPDTGGDRDHRSGADVDASGGSASGSDALADPAANATITHPADAAACLTQAAWRLVAVEFGPAREARTWFAMETMSQVAGPTDPTIPFRRLMSEHVVAIGFCAPDVDVAVGPSTGFVRATGARVWQVAGGAAEELVDVELVERPGSGIAELYRPATDRPRTWPPADYVFQVGHPLGGELWFGLRIAPRRR